MTKRLNPYEKLSVEEIEKLIECYFECTLDEDDEMSLRKVISATSFDTPAIREAKAVMGYGAVLKDFSDNHSGTVAKGSSKRIRWHIAASTAAAVALLIGISAFLHRSPGTMPDGDVCVAYVNGQRIDNKEAVMQMMKVDLLTMQSGSETVSGGIDNDLSALRDAIGELN